MRCLVRPAGYSRARSGLGIVGVGHDRFEIDDRGPIDRFDRTQVEAVPPHTEDPCAMQTDGIRTVR